MMNEKEKQLVNHIDISNFIGTYFINLTCLDEDIKSNTRESGANNYSSLRSVMKDINKFIRQNQ